MPAVFRSFGSEAASGMTAVEGSEELRVGPADRLSWVGSQWSRRVPRGGVATTQWRRRPIMLALSLLVVVTSAAVFSDSYAHARQLTPVLEVAAPVRQGQVIVASDLSEADVEVGRSVSVVAAGQAGTVVGARAAVPLTPGELLSSAELTRSTPLAAGDAEVGVVAGDGQLPSAGLTPGETVMVVETSPPGAPAASGSTAPGLAAGTAAVGTPAASGVGGSESVVLVPAAQVVDVREGASGSGSTAATLVSLVVPAAAAPSVAVAAAADEVALVLLPSPGSSSAGQGGSGGA
ncbi:MAG: SAF domain-containing protein [Actinomycetota bacterium]|nr:SAF domain-containing protein [Actinomycetota bacterium]